MGEQRGRTRTSKCTMFSSIISTSSSVSEGKGLKYSASSFENHGIFLFRFVWNEHVHFTLYSTGKRTWSRVYIFVSMDRRRAWPLTTLYYPPTRMMAMQKYPLKVEILVISTSNVPQNFTHPKKYHWFSWISSGCDHRRKVIDHTTLHTE